MGASKGTCDEDVQGIEQLEKTNDEDDEDFVDDEEVDREYNESIDDEGIDTIADLKQPVQGDQLAKLRNIPVVTGANIALSDSITNDSVSPITKSTHRMSKAMQVNSEAIRHDFYHAKSTTVPNSFAYSFNRLLIRSIRFVRIKGVDHDTALT